MTILTLCVYIKNVNEYPDIWISVQWSEYSGQISVFRYSVNMVKKHVWWLKSGNFALTVCSLIETEPNIHLKFTNETWFGIHPSVSWHLGLLTGVRVPSMFNKYCRW